ncbi:Rhodanese-like protein [Testicularia cyperi]|uniref:Rhodanese-like protein n=1 Tax=Testicularia cyperi TaxID=1882483 RepID=A0A317XLE1_9BASI|nr:Rhodanese-like protein [Testicularia cyperi]
MSGAVVARGATPSSAVACCEALSPVARVAVVSASRLQSRVFSSTRTALSKDTTWQSKGAVTYAELKPETESPSGEITIIDVREPNEVAQGIIPSAVNVPLSQFQKAFSGSGGDFIRDFAFNRPEYDDKVVFYCRSGKRSQQALEFAQKNGWWNTRNYEGSWLDWVQQEEARGQASKIKEDDD